MHVRGLRPFAVGLAAVDQVLLFRAFHGQRFGVGAAPFAAAGNHEPGIALHALVVRPENAVVPVALPEAVGNQHPRVRPAHAAVHHAHVKVHAAGGSNLRQAAAALLPVVHVVHILARKRGEIKQIRGGVEENLRVARPAVALAGGAVGGNVREIALGRPHRGLHKPVQQLVGAVEPAGALQIGIHRHGREILGKEGHVGVHQHIPEAEDGEGGLVRIDSLPAKVFHLLQGRGDFPVCTLDVLLGELALPVQHLAKAQEHPLPRPGPQGEGNVAGDVLAKVQHGFARGGGEERRGQALMFGDGHVVRGGGHNRVAGHSCAPGIGGLQPRVHNFPVLVVGKADGAVVAPGPGAVRADHLRRAVRMGNLQLGQELCLRAVLVLQPPRAAAAAIPAVGQLHGQRVFARVQKGRHVVGLNLHPPAVIRQAGGQDEISCPRAVEPRLIQAAGGDVQPGPAHGGHGEGLAEAVHGIPPLPVHPVIAGNPLPLPAVNAGFKGGRLPVAGGVVLVPEADFPHDPGFRRHGCAAPGCPHGAGNDLPAVPQHRPCVILRSDAVGGLHGAALAVPQQAGSGDVNAHGVCQIFGFQSDGLHGSALLPVTSAGGP